MSKITKQKTFLFIVLVVLMILYIFGRLYIGGWLLLKYWYIFLSIPIIYSFIRIRYIKSVRFESKKLIKYTILSYLLFLLFILFQVDVGDGQYNIVIVSLFNLKDLKSLINDKITIDFWLYVQGALGANLMIFEIILYKKLRNKMITS